MTELGFGEKRQLRLRNKKNQNRKHTEKKNVSQETQTQCRKIEEPKPQLSEAQITFYLFEFGQWVEVSNITVLRL